MTNDSRLQECAMCPRKCKANRFTGPFGYCRADAGSNVASVVIHHGEEPLISGQHGICNVFFQYCNLRCAFCQNHQISAPSVANAPAYSNPKDVVNAIISALDQGCRNLGFVSPSHQIPQMQEIYHEVVALEYRPVIVYNTNAYDLPEVIDEVATMVDVWLPDFKYMDARLAGRWSDAPDYPQHALTAIKRMYRYSGSTLRVEDGIAVSGMIIRHLVMPGAVDNSIQVLETIADNLGTDVAISLMSQYYPTNRTLGHAQLGRTLYEKEYKQVVERLDQLGFYKGWVQDLDSNAFYRPDFERGNPFDQFHGN